MIQNPKILLTRFKIVFQMICFLSAIFMSASFVRRFNANDNATSITYKKFNRKPQDVYPTFSICFRGTNFHWYNDIGIYDAFELRPEQYETMVKGETAFRYEYDTSLRLFSKRPTFLNNETSSESKSFHLQLSNFLIEANFTTLNKKDSRFFTTKNMGNLSELPFSINYQTSEAICFERDSTYVSNLIRMEDVLTLRRSLMENVLYKDTDIQIFIHYPNHLIRSLAMPSFTSSFPHYQHNKQLSFKMAQSTMIRRRPDYNDPCNSAMVDYDRYLMNVVINETKCTPPYWNGSIKDTSGFEVCLSQEQLQRVYKNLTEWESVMKGHDRPCVDMYNIVGWNWEDVEGVTKSDEIRITFYYQEQYYQELEYLPDFDAETFISNIGGFVGIFLGYSMMQFPELIGNSRSNFNYCNNAHF